MYFSHLLFQLFCLSAIRFSNYFLICALLALRTLKSYINGEPMKIEAYVPTRIPTNNATAKPRITSPPKIAMANITIAVEPEVLMVRDKVLFNASFTFSAKARFG